MPFELLIFVRFVDFLARDSGSEPAGCQNLLVMGDSAGLSAAH